jgi:predicted DNA-binding transcriptional regulator AlpA
MRRTNISEREQARREQQRTSPPRSSRPILKNEPAHTIPVTDTVDGGSVGALAKALDARPPPNDPLSLIGKRELARLLGVNPWTLDRWRRTDPGFPAPLWLNGTTPRWRRVDIESWLATRQRGGVAPDCKPPTTNKKRRG